MPTPPALSRRLPGHGSRNGRATASFDGRVLAFTAGALQQSGHRRRAPSLSRLRPRPRTVISACRARPTSRPRSPTWWRLAATIRFRARFSVGNSQSFHAPGSARWHGRDPRDQQAGGRAQCGRAVPARSQARGAVAPSRRRSIRFLPRCRRRTFAGSSPCATGDRSGSAPRSAPIVRGARAAGVDCAQWESGRCGSDPCQLDRRLRQPGTVDGVARRPASAPFVDLDQERRCGCFQRRTAAAPPNGGSGGEGRPGDGDASGFPRLSRWCRCAPSRLARRTGQDRRPSACSRSRNRSMAPAGNRLPQTPTRCLPSCGPIFPEAMREATSVRALLETVAGCRSWRGSPIHGSRTTPRRGTNRRRTEQRSAIEAGRARARRPCCAAPLQVGRSRVAHGRVAARCRCLGRTVLAGVRYRCQGDSAEGVDLGEIGLMREVALQTVDVLGTRRASGGYALRAAAVDFGRGEHCPKSSDFSARRRPNRPTFETRY